MLVVPCARHILLRTPPGVGNIDEEYILIKCLATVPLQPQTELLTLSNVIPFGWTIRLPKIFSSRPCKRALK
jgi:hypothetical protein